jgi:hypothetical protein
MGGDQMSFSNASLPCTITPNPCTGFKAWKKCVLIPQLGLPVCHQGSLASLVVVASGSLPTPTGSCTLLPTFLCCLSVFPCSATLSLFHDSQCSSSLSLFRMFSLLWYPDFSFMESSGSGFLKKYGTGFEFRTLHLQSRCSTAWLTPPVCRGGF